MLDSYFLPLTDREVQVASNIILLKAIFIVDKLETLMAKNSSNLRATVRKKEAASCLEQAVNLYYEIGRLDMAARYYMVVSLSSVHELDIRLEIWFTNQLKEIVEYYESDQNIDQTIAYFEKGACLYNL
ncbi:Tetratricopeptide-like helical domain superfamily [Arabidopsis thaliana x Arabidopsis arenosa]|uniref:Tetratricopeptide-like helical domain superfamily n=1 Tax=Arabidopsis thaliana x Arabidopsis arenosa TaxID=1240361 RepID=A0A8T1YAQ1_9BRAS|nr:Tetratricopeptide-like helical domain superfamily [Arabidopsis thaliana x Arabidopsis arenosa]